MENLVQNDKNASDTKLILRHKGGRES